MEKEKSKKGICVEFITAQTETDKAKAYDVYQLAIQNQVSKATFYALWNEVKGKTDSVTKIKINREDIVQHISTLYKEQTPLIMEVQKHKIQALLTKDATEKKKLLEEAERAMDAYQKKNFEIRRYLETNPLT